MDNNDKELHGINIDILKYLSRSLNFTYEIIRERNGPGYQSENKSWTGMIGRIYDQVSYK